MNISRLIKKTKKIIGRNSNISNLLNNFEIIGQEVIFNINKDVLKDNKSFLILKCNNNNTFLEEEIKSNVIKFSVNDVLNLTNKGIIEIGLKQDGDFYPIKYSSKFESAFTSFQNKFIYSQENHSNLIFRIGKISPKYNITSLKCINDEICVEGELLKIDKNVFNNLKNNFFIEIKHRKSGKYLEQPLTGNIKFDVSELFDLDDEGYFDIYFKFKQDSFIHKKRCLYQPNHQFFKAISLSNQKIIKSFRTKFNNLSLLVYDENWDSNVHEIKVNDSHLFLKGDLRVINKDIKNISDSKIIIKQRDAVFNEEFDLNISKINDSDSEYEFSANLDISIDIDEEFFNERYDFYIRLYDDDIYYENLIDLTNYASFYKNEDKFVGQFKQGNFTYSYYANSDNNLSLWVTVSESFEKSYKLTKGRSIFDENLNKSIDNNLVFFESFFGKAYSGNPKYIYEKMLEMGLDKKYKFVWAYSGEDKDIIPGNPIIVERYEPGDYYKYLAQAKYWVNNIIFPVHKKRSKTVYLQTWHGTPLKKLGFDIAIDGPEVAARNNFYKESRNWDYMISSNPYSSKIFKRAFKFNRDIIEVGYPANDIFFKDNNELIKNLKSKYNIPEDKKIILYAPTWKDDEQVASWKHYFNLEIDLKRLYEEFNDKYVVLLKMHHLVSEKLVIDDQLENFVFDLSGHDDIQELYLLSDLLITDYSSVFFDYAHLKRPILFFVPDLEHYLFNVRGLYLDMTSELPGPLVYDNDQLINCIKNIDDIEVEYSMKYDEFYQEFCSLCKGESAKKVIEEIFEI